MELSFKVLNTKNYIFQNIKLNLLIYIYIDDLAIIRPNLDTINSIISKLKSYLKLKNLGPIKDYLRIKINYTLNKYLK